MVNGKQQGRKKGEHNIPQLYVRRSRGASDLIRDILHRAAIVGDHLPLFGVRVEIMLLSCAVNARGACGEPLCGPWPCQPLRPRRRETL